MCIKYIKITFETIRKQTSDAHERSIIEDYYYTINDDLRKYLKNYLQYEKCSSASRRLANFYRKKEQDYLAVVKQESTLKRNIDNLKQELHKMDDGLSVSNIWFFLKLCLMLYFCRV